MISIPPSTGWVERAYSVLEIICQKLRNRINVSSLGDLFFLAILKLPVKDTFCYKKRDATAHEKLDDSCQVISYLQHVLLYIHEKKEKVLQRSRWFFLLIAFSVILSVSTFTNKLDLNQ